jgi:pyruvate dehydrogenase E2 component (dihydrolipoamide acetyltransferase)
MISEVVMPQMGADMTEGTLVKWLKNEGDSVERGEIIAEIETDKANVEIEAFESGVFRKALAQEGDVIEVGGLIGVIAAADEDISKYENGAAPTAGAQPAADSSPAPATSLPIQPAPVDVPRPTAVEPRAAVASGRVRISPVARRIAEDHNIDIRTLTGTGPGGRIIKRDVEAAFTVAGSQVAGSPRMETGNVRSVAPSRMRQAIARRMSQSKREAPHYYLLLDVDMTSALEIRMQYNEALATGDVAAPPDTKASINDMLVRAAALALRKHPEFNATIDESGAITQHPQQNICIGIALDDGLIAPAILDAGSKSLAEIAGEAKDLIARAKNGKMRPPEINDGTFTITNLGAYGVETLIGIIQPPQTAILGAGSVMPQSAVRDGQVVVRQVMKVALSADHRATDGAQGAQFLSELRRLLENPVLLVV